MDLYEALYTTRAMRRVKPDPVPDEVVQSMLDAAIRAPSGSNAQQWRMVAVTDPDTRAALGELYADAYRQLHETIYDGWRERTAQSGDDQARRVISSSDWLGENFGQVPLVVLFFDRNDPTGGSIYPAVWSLQLAARGHGIGTTLTTILGRFKQSEVFELLGVPADKGWALKAAIPCGFPMGRWGIAKRKAVNEVAYLDRWEGDLPWTIDEPLWGGTS
ncbi:MAG: nitroreductase family protein [Acidimicrobiia bacterium]|nr:nitroreductase family protein [Acidimicrobiia bacterium]